MPTLHVAHSPDSDDAFMFWALAAEKIDTEDRRYIHELADIETLNQRAMKGELEITAVFRLSPRNGHSEAHAGLPVLTHLGSPALPSLIRHARLP